MPSPAVHPRRILIIRPSALGDVCRTVPVLVSLKRAFPDADMDWLVRDAFVDAVRAHPDVHRVVEFPRRRFSRWWSPAVAIDVVRWLRTLARDRYDLVVDCQGLARSGFFCLTTRAARRVGYANAAELGWLGLTDRIPVPRSLHAVDRMLALVQAIGARPVPDLRLYVPPEEANAVRADPSLGRARYAVIAPTTTWPGKRWPIGRFATLARRLVTERADRFDTVVVVGAATERSQCGPLLDLAARDERIIDRVGQTSVGRLMAIVERSSLVVANDSACLHMAVGLDRPLVGLFGPTRVELVGPYGRAHQVIQRVDPTDRLDHKDGATGAALMHRISVEDVMAKVEEGLQGSRDQGIKSESRAATAALDPSIP